MLKQRLRAVTRKRAPLEKGVEALNLRRKRAPHVIDKYRIQGLPLLRQVPDSTVQVGAGHFAFRAPNGFLWICGAWLLAHEKDGMKSCSKRCLMASITTKA